MDRTRVHAGNRPEPSPRVPGWEWRQWALVNALLSEAKKLGLHQDWMQPGSVSAEDEPPSVDAPGPAPADSG